MWQAIEYILYGILIGCLITILWLLLIPSKQHFTVVLKTGEHLPGCVVYIGRRNEAALRAEIIALVEEQYPDEEVAAIYLG